MALRGATVAALSAALLAAVATSGAGAAPSRSADADLVVAGPAAPSHLSVGQAQAYTFTLSNAGPSEAYTPVMWVNASPLGSIVGAAVSSPGVAGTCAVTAPRTVKCTPSYFPNGSTFSATVTVTATAPGHLTVTARAGSRSSDPNRTNDLAQVTTAAYPIDHDPPTDVSTITPGPAVASPTIPIDWRASDSVSGVASYAVRYRSARPGASLGPYVTWRQGVTSRSDLFTGSPGATYCFSTSAVDHQGNVSAWSADRCVTVPLPATSLVRVGRWTVSHSSSAFLGTYVSAKAKGATLVLRRVRARSLDVLLDPCPGCGVLEISLGGHVLRRINLDRGSIRQATMIDVLRGSQVVSGSLSLRVLSSGKPVSVEGVALSTVAAPEAAQTP